MSGGVELHVRVAGVEQVARSVKQFRLAAVSGEPLPPFSGGAHVVVSMDAGKRKIRNPYSLVDRAPDGSSYSIAVALSPESRGGSTFMHELTPGRELVIAMPVNLFPLVRTGRKHVFVAGGIGVTPVYALAEDARREGRAYEIHYAMRDAESGAFVEALRRAHGGRLHIYRSALGERLSFDAILAHQPLGAHLYVCGPDRLIDAALEAGHLAGWPKESLHAERFVAPGGGRPFLARLQRSGIDVKVRGDQSLLEALEEAGVDAPYLCRGGACGQCEIPVASFDGELAHADHYLSDAERASGKKIMTCVSRLNGRELVLDL